MPEAQFTLDPRLGSDTYRLGRFPLSELLWMNDARYPWAILVPRLPDVREIYQLSVTDQQQLLRESSRLGAALMAHFNGHKLNVAALGNVVAQLHLHHVVRMPEDHSWPGPVWGVGQAEPYERDRLAALLSPLLQALQQAEMTFTPAPEWWA